MLYPQRLLPLSCCGRECNHTPGRLVSVWMNMNYMNAFIIIQTSCCCQVYPIQGFPDQEICEVSTKLINEHLERFTATSRILQQVQIHARGPLGRSQTPSLRFVALCHSERPISLLSVRASSWCPSLMPITPTAGKTTASSSTGWRTKCLPPNIPLHVPSCRQHGIDI